MSWKTVIISLVVIILILVIQFILIPWLRLNARRRISRDHSPQPGELWTQDEELLYVEHVDSTGIEVMATDQQSGSVDRWKDTWPQWYQRCRLRTVIFTGQVRPLRPAQ